MSLIIKQEAAPTDIDWVLERRLPSQMEFKEELVEAITACMEERQWFCEDDRHWLLLCLDEAIVNAMIHGNEGDPRLCIDVRVGSKEDTKQWIIMVSDEGEGFSPEDVPDANDPDSLLLEHGRGILLMNEWLDELVYYDNGSTIYMARSYVKQEQGS